MAAKFDQEAMKKHHFWLLMIPVCIGLLLAWIGVIFNVDEATAAKGKENGSARDAIKSAKAQSKKTLDVYDQRKGELFDLRTVRWQEMWNAQKAVFDWPQQMGNDLVAKVQNLKFGDTINDERFVNQFRDKYITEYETLSTEAAPLQFQGGWRNVLRHVGSWTRLPSPEEIWLAMEDLWVQRELVVALNQVNREAGRFQPVDPPGGAAPNPQKRAFQNRIFRLDLELVDVPNGKAVKGTVTNRTQKLQAFNATSALMFKVWLNADEGAKPYFFAIEGTAIEGGKTEPIKYVEARHKIFEGQPNGLFRVEQVYDTRTAAVKRLDKLILGYTSDRHSQAELVMTPFSQKNKEAEEGGGSASASGSTASTSGGGTTSGAGSVYGGGTGAGGGGGGGNMMSMMLGGGAQGGSTTDATFHKLVRKRYIHRTDQVRAMPVGLTVVCDQEYLPDVLAALANSRLRFQTVQSHVNRFRGTLNYAPPSSESSTLTSAPAGGAAGGEAEPGGGLSPAKLGGGPPGGGGGPPGGMGMMMMSGMPKGMGSGMPGGLGGFSTAVRSSGDDQVATDVVDFSVYGIIAVYEKFELPAEKKDGTATTTPNTPTTPGATTNPAPPNNPMPPADGKANTPMPPTDGKAPTAPGETKDGKGAVDGKDGKAPVVPPKQ